MQIVLLNENFIIGVRISTPMNHFKSLQHPILKSTGAEELFRRYDSLMQLLGELEDRIFNDWSTKVSKIIELNLRKSLIGTGQAEDKSLFLNFDKKLFALLCELRHLKVMCKENIPIEGLNFAENNDIYREYTLNLGKTIDWYNNVIIVHLNLLFCLQ